MTPNNPSRFSLANFTSDYQQEVNEKRSTIYYQYCAFKGLFYQETRRYIRIAMQTTVSPLFFRWMHWIIFLSLNPAGQLVSGISYAPFLLSGIIFFGLITDSCGGITGSLYPSKFYGTFETTLVTPAHYGTIIAAYLCSSMLRAWVNALLFLLLVFVIHPVVPTLTMPSNWFGIFFLSNCLLALAGLSGVIIALYAHSFDHLQFFETFFLTTTLWFAGTFSDIAKLPRWIGTLAAWNPFTLLLAHFRGLWLGTPSSHTWMFCTICLSMLLLAFLLASRMLHKGFGQQCRK